MHGARLDAGYAHVFTDHDPVLSSALCPQGASRPTGIHETRADVLGLQYRISF
jgi:hypothetical protein